MIRVILRRAETNVHFGRGGRESEEGWQLEITRGCGLKAAPPCEFIQELIYYRLN